MSEFTRPFPSKVLVAASVLIALTISAAAIAKWSGWGATREPQSAASQIRDLRFEDREDGAIAVVEADGRVVEVLAPGTSGFVRIVMRSLARERRLNDQGPQAPFRLVRWADGRLSMEDPVTGRRIDLGAFGSANTQSFARLMVAGVETR
jgi:putative photosynthetic complex assembly protein